MLNFHRVNQDSLIIYFGEDIDEQLPPIIASFCEQLMGSCGDLIVDIVPAYISVLVVFDDRKITYANFSKLLRDLLYSQEDQGEIKLRSQHFKIPVFYSPELAADLLTLCDQKTLTPNELINIHSQKVYTVYAVGFSPGFSYLGEVDRAIAAPRLASPRTRVPAGSVGIAETQTGVYPSESPGGWNIIGRTPLELFSPERFDFPLRIGDRVKFCPIDGASYKQLQGCSLLDFQSEIQI